MVPSKWEGKAVGVSLSYVKEFFARTVVSNATRWDTFFYSAHIFFVEAFSLGKNFKVEDLPEEEKNFQKSYVKAPSLLSIHMCVQASVLRGCTDCHHFILQVNCESSWQDDWPNLQKPYGIIFLSIPTVIDPSLPPEGHRILHIFTTTGIEDLEGLSRKDYEQKKELVSKEIIRKLEKGLFPGLQDSIVLREEERHSVYCY